MSDIIDLNEARERRQAKHGWHAERPKGTYAIATGPDEVELRIDVVEGAASAVVLSAGMAGALARALSRASAQALKLNKPACESCGRHGCRRWHVGREYRGWRKGRQVRVLCERLCKRSVRLIDTETGEVFYGYSEYSWEPVAEGELG